MRHLWLAWLTGSLLVPAHMPVQAPVAQPAQVLVPVFGGQGVSGVEAAQHVRAALALRLSPTGVEVVQETRMSATLEASGFWGESRISPSDEVALANLMRAGEIVTGVASRRGGTIRFRARLVLTRDGTLSQPLPDVEDGTLEDAARRLAEEVVRARAQLDGERRCVQALGERRVPEARTAAEEGVRSYARSTLARTCLATALLESPAEPRRALEVARELLALDCTSRAGPWTARMAHQQLGNADSVRWYGERYPEVFAERAARVPRR